MYIKNSNFEKIKKNCYDLIVLYMVDHDSFQHTTCCFSEECTEQFCSATDRFEQFASLMDEYYRDKNHMLIFVPDLVGHLIEENKGTHGFDVPEDMLVSHYCRLREKC